MSFSGPAVGTVNNNSDVPASATATIPAQTTAVDNGYATYSYDSSLKPVEPELIKPPILASNIFRIRAAFTWQLSATVLSVANNGGQVDSSLQLRRGQPDKYKETTEHIGGTDFIIMSSIGSASNDKVAYTFKDGKVGEIAITGYQANHQEQNQRQLEEIFRNTLASWHWK